MTTDPSPEELAARDRIPDEMRLAKILRSADESGIDSLAAVESQVDNDLTPLELEKLRSASQCMQTLEQLRNAQGQSDEATSTGLADKRLDSSLSVPAVGSFERYSIIRQIAEGGFSRVFLATDQILGRKVALKILRPELQFSSSAVLRFEREARAAGALAHPAIIPVFDSGTTGESFFIAFEFCHGESLAEYIKQSKLDTETSAAIVARIAEAVEHAHRNGVIHRDLKPANILIDQSKPDLPFAQRVRVTDFGLALQQHQDQQKLTTTGTLVGTPVYMSPEQINNGDEIGTATDIYSLGVVLHELLVHQVPHKKGNYASTLHAVASKQVNSLRHIDPSVPRDLEAICLKCLSHEPTDRYESAFALSEDLQRYLNRQPIAARKIGAAGHLKRWTKRNPWLAVSIATAFLALAAGICGTSWMWIQSEKNRLVAENLRIQESAAKQIAQRRSQDLGKQVEILKSIFTNLNPFNESLDDASLRQRLSERLVESADLIVDSSDDVSLQIALLESLSNSLASLGRAKVAKDVADMALEIASATENLKRPDWIRAKSTQAFALNALSKHEQSKEIFAEIKDELLDSPHFDEREKAMMLMMLAHQWFADAYDQNLRHGYREANEIFQELLASTNAESPDNEVQTSRLVARFRLAEIASLLDKEHTENMETVIKDAEQKLGQSHTMTISFLNHYAISLSSNKKVKEAIRVSEIAYERSRNKFGASSGQTLEALDALIVACGKSTRSSTSRKRLREVLPIAQQICENQIQSIGLSDQKLFVRFGNVGTAWGLVGELDKCISIKQQLVDASTKEFGRNHVTTQVQLMALGYALRAAGKLNEAESGLKEFLTFAQAISEPDNSVWQQRIRTTNKELMLINTLKLFQLDDTALGN